jgi:hypothetical protein
MMMIFSFFIKGEGHRLSVVLKSEASDLRLEKIPDEPETTPAVTALNVPVLRRGEFSVVTTDPAPLASVTVPGEIVLVCKASESVCEVPKTDEPEISRRSVTGMAAGVPLVFKFPSFAPTRLEFFMVCPVESGKLLLNPIPELVGVGRLERCSEEETAEGVPLVFAFPTTELLPRSVMAGLFDVTPPTTSVDELTGELKSASLPAKPDASFVVNVPVVVPVKLTFPVSEDVPEVPAFAVLVSPVVPPSWA